MGKEPGERAVKIAVCEQNRAQREQLCSWVWQICRAHNLEPELVAYDSSEALLAAMQLRRFDVLLLSKDGPEGFLAARQLRERDLRVRIVFLTDTSRYAVMGVRLHLADYIVKPAEFRHLSRALQLCGIGGGR